MLLSSTDQTIDLKSGPVKDQKAFYYMLYTPSSNRWYKRCHMSRQSILFFKCIYIYTDPNPQTYLLLDHE